VPLIDDRPPIVPSTHSDNTIEPIDIHRIASVRSDDIDAIAPTEGTVYNISIDEIDMALNEKACQQLLRRIATIANTNYRYIPKAVLKTPHRNLHEIIVQAEKRNLNSK